MKEISQTFKAMKKLWYPRRHRTNANAARLALRDKIKLEISRQKTTTEVTGAERMHN